MSRDVLVGGQAVIEGVLMRNKDRLAIAVRKPDETVSLKKLRTGSLVNKYKILKMPFVRGVVNLVETLVLGTKALNYSANESLGEEEEKLSTLTMFLTTGFAFLLGIGLFILLPLWITKFLHSEVGYVFNIIDGFFRLAIFLVYLLAISMMDDVKRLFQYHGAEHKSVNCYEAGKALTVKNVKKFTTLHRRCGTTFLMFVLAISIVIFTFIVSESFWVQFGGRLLLMPVVAGTSYEILKLGAKYPSNPIVNALLQPGFLLQKITTREPDEKQIEVAIKALKAVVGKEKRAKIQLVL